MQLTGPLAVNILTEWASRARLPFTVRGQRLCVDYETMTMEFYRTPEAYVLRVIESYGGAVRWVEELHADGAHVLRTRTDEPRGYAVVCPGWRAGLAGSLDAAFIAARWWHHTKNLF